MSMRWRVNFLEKRVESLVRVIWVGSRGVGLCGFIVSHTGHLNISSCRFVSHTQASERIFRMENS
ncbi:hypothetical protein Hdeb2414_s0016g00478951 [Helianthus debilis subsp. tardiflorus]